MVAPVTLPRGTAIDLGLLGDEQSPSRGTPEGNLDLTSPCGFSSRRAARSIASSGSKQPTACRRHRPDLPPRRPARPHSAFGRHPARGRARQLHDLNNFWVAIQPQTGLTITANVALRDGSDPCGPLARQPQARPWEDADVKQIPGPLALWERVSIAGPLSLWERVRVRAATVRSCRWDCAVACPTLRFPWCGAADPAPGKPGRYPSPRHPISSLARFGRGVGGEGPHPNPLPKEEWTRRRGVSLVEILICLFIILFGLLGVAALLPVGRYDIMVAARADRGAACAAPPCAI